MRVQNLASRSTFLWALFISLYAYVIGMALANRNFLLLIPLIGILFFLCFFQNIIEAGLFFLLIFSLFISMGTPEIEPLETNLIAIPFEVPGLFSRFTFPLIIILPLFVIWLLKDIPLKGLRIRLDKINLSLLTLLCIGLLSIIINPRATGNPKDNFLAISLYFTCIAGYLLAADCIERSKGGGILNIMAFLIAMLSAAFINTIFMVWLFVRSGAILWKDSAISVTLGGGCLGCFYILVISVCLGIIFESSVSKWLKAALFFLSSFLLFGLILNFARAAFVGMFASVSMILFFRRKKNFALFFGLAGLVLAYSPAWNLMLDIFTTRQIPSSYARFVVWKDAIGVFREHFFTGVGPGNYFFYPSFRGQYGQMASAHNNYLQIAAEMGIFGLFVFLGFLFIALREAISLYRTTASKLFKSLSLAFIGTIAGVSVASIFGDFILPAKENAGHVSIRATIYFWILLGLVMGAKRVEQGENNQKKNVAQEDCATKR